MEFVVVPPQNEKSLIKKMWFLFKEVGRKYIFLNIFATSNKNQTTELCPTSSNLNFFGKIFFYFVDALRSVI